MVSKICVVSKIIFSKITFWTDSTIVLGRIKTPPNQLKTFVCNRVAAIQSFNQEAKWRHVRTKDNPVDIVSRSTTANTLQNCQLWWHGPSWLLKPESQWPDSIYEHSHKLPELKRVILVFACQIVEPVIEVNRFSKLSKLKNNFVYCLRFIRNCKRSLDKREFGPLTCDELKNSELLIIKLIQQSIFTPDYQNLLNSTSLSKRSKLLNLAPIMDNNQIML